MEDQNDKKQVVLITLVSVVLASSTAALIASGGGRRLVAGRMHGLLGESLELVHLGRSGVLWGGLRLSAGGLRSARVLGLQEGR